MRVFAWVAVGMLLSPLGYAADPPLGRLFFTGTERAALEDARRRAQFPKASQAELVNTGVIKPHATVRFSGMVKRSDGVSAIWVNGKQYYGKERPDDIGLLPHDAGSTISVKLPESGKRVTVRVGQDMDATSGAVAERFSLREVPAAVKSPVSETPAQKRRTVSAGENAEPTQVEPGQEGEENIREPTRAPTKSY